MLRFVHEPTNVLEKLPGKFSVRSSLHTGLICQLLALGVAHVLSSFKYFFATYKEKAGRYISMLIVLFTKINVEWDWFRFCSSLDLHGVISTILYTEINLLNEVSPSRIFKCKILIFAARYIKKSSRIVQKWVRQYKT